MPFSVYQLALIVTGIVTGSNLSVYGIESINK